MSDRWFVGASAERQPAHAGGSTSHALTASVGLQPWWIRFLLWFGDALGHALGGLTGSDDIPPPLLGVQPYHDLPQPRRGRR